MESWSWDFGDGSGSAEQHPNHTYEADGTYQVTLVVADDQAATGTVTQPVSANAPAAGP